MDRDKKGSGKLDAVLSTPLREIADDGFLQTVRMRLDARRRRWLLLQIGAGLLTIGVCAAIVPMNGLVEAIALLSPETIGFVPLALAVVVTALSVFGEQLWNE